MQTINLCYSIICIFQCHFYHLYQFFRNFQFLHSTIQFCCGYGVTSLFEVDEQQVQFHYLFLTMTLQHFNSKILVYQYLLKITKSISDYQHLFNILASFLLCISSLSNHFQPSSFALVDLLLF